MNPQPKGTQMLRIVLKVSSPMFVLVGCLHLILGLHAEVLLGANIGPDTINNAVLDSQNRFYGVAFLVYGFLLYICATDLERYQTVLRTLLWVFFAAGCARLVSIALYGMPTSLVLALLAVELIAPPLLIVWLSSTLNENLPSTQGNGVDA